MKWIKQHSDSDFHPQIQLAGFWGARVFELLCRVSGQFDLKGNIPPQHLHPELLAKRLQATDILPLPEAAKAVADGIQRLVLAGLAEETEDGGLVLDGWERVQGGTSTERVRKHRERKVKATHQKRKETVSAVSETQGNEAVTQETLKKRRDKSREEERDPPCSPPPGDGGDSPPPRKPKRRKRERELSATSLAVQALVREQRGAEYPPAAFDALEARLAAKELDHESALAIARFACGDPFWGGQVDADPSTLYRPKHWPSLLAKARAGPGKPPPPRSQRPGHEPFPDEYARLV